MTMSKEPAGDDPRPAGEDPQRATTDDPDTHTAPLQGAAAGGAASGNAGYATGLLTGSENDIGMRPIPEPADTSRREASDRAPIVEGLPPGPDADVARRAIADANNESGAGTIATGPVADPDA